MVVQAPLISRLKVQLKLSIARLRMTQQKDTAVVKQQRREMAQLLEQGKLESARIRIENIIRSELTTELHEILELYCELVLARSQLLDPHTGTPAKKGEPPADIDSGLEEAIRAIIYAAPRTEIKELHQSRALLAEKFGKEFTQSCMERQNIPERVTRKLETKAPEQKLVDDYLRIIAEAYDVPLPKGLQLPEVVDEAAGSKGDDDDDDDEPGSGGARNKALEAPLEAEDLTAATPPRNLGLSTPIKIAPQSPSTENPVPKLKLPGTGDSVSKERERKQVSAAAAAPPVGKAPSGKIPNADDELLKRLANLKGA